jgi:hypothetical protein
MIMPNMATASFLLVTDAAVDPDISGRLFREAVDDSFNIILLTVIFQPMIQPLSWRMAWPEIQPSNQGRRAVRFEKLLWRHLVRPADSQTAKAQQSLSNSVLRYSTPMRKNRRPLQLSPGQDRFLWPDANWGASLLPGNTS